jgi:hypothetical protein
MSLGEGLRRVREIRAKAARMKDDLDEAARLHEHHTAAREMGVGERDADDLSHGPS